MHLSMRIGLVLGITFILLSCGFLPAIGQDSPQSPPHGYDQGVWVLTDKKSTVEKDNGDLGFYSCALNVNVAENSVTTSCSDTEYYTRLVGCSGYISGTCTWTVPPSVLTPGTKQETTETAKVDCYVRCDENKDFKYGGYTVRCELYVNGYDVSPYAQSETSEEELHPAPVSETIPWDVPWGKTGDTMSIEFNPHMGGVTNGGIVYTYTYQASAAQPAGNQPVIACDRLILDLNEGANSVVIAKVVEACGEHKPLKDADLDIRIFHTWDEQLKKAINGEFVDLPRKTTHENGEATIQVTGNPGDIYRVDVYASKGGWDTSDRSIHVTIGGQQTATDWNNKGIALKAQGKYDEAIEAFDEAIRLDPNDASAWKNKGLALSHQDKYDEAIQAYDEAIRLDPQDAYNWIYKGRVLKSLGLTTKADEAFAKAKELGYAG
jgi:hypothetical protein